MRIGRTASLSIFRRAQVCVGHPYDGLSFCSAGQNRTLHTSYNASNKTNFLIPKDVMPMNMHTKGRVFPRVFNSAKLLVAPTVKTRSRTT